jgi:dTDP-4-amino-4,6-dideoxygalactose transaminase
MRDFIPFAKADLTEREFASVDACLRSGWLTTGKRAREFEADFLRYIGVDGTALAVNSATAGLHLALEAVGVGPGDEVVVPTHTFTATAEVVRYLGADPVLCDVDPRTLNCTLETILPHVSPRTRAIIAVHFAGLAAEMDPILHFARQRKIAVIEDAAHALPTTYGGRLVGSLDSDATVFSFYATKPLATGEGGMLVTRHPEVARRCAVMRRHGIDHDAFARHSEAGAAWRYDVIAPGFKYNLTDIAASLGIVQLSRVDEMAARRGEIAAAYLASFQGLPLTLPALPPPRERHAWHLFAIRLLRTARLDRDAFIVEMARRRIGCSVHWIPLHMHTYWRTAYRLTDGHFPVATEAFSGLVSLPIYSAMTVDESERVIDAVRELLTVA